VLCLCSRNLTLSSSIHETGWVSLRVFESGKSCNFTVLDRVLNLVSVA
jgi:hypothetical protein